MDERAFPTPGSPLRQRSIFDTVSRQLVVLEEAHQRAGEAPEAQRHFREPHQALAPSGPEILEMKLGRPLIDSGGGDSSDLGAIRCGHGWTMKRTWELMGRCGHWEEAPRLPTPGFDGHFRHNRDSPLHHTGAIVSSLFTS